MLTFQMTLTLRKVKLQRNSGQKSHFLTIFLFAIHCKSVFYYLKNFKTLRSVKLACVEVLGEQSELKTQMFIFVIRIF